jgi:hypothetical protein
MSLSLLQLLGKYLTVSIISCMSMFGISNYSEINIAKNNNLLNKKGETVNSINYKTVVKYNSKLPSNITNTIKEGQVGLSINNGKTNKIIKEPTDAIVEKGTGRYGISKGKLVGYGPDCKGCSGEGYLACRTEDGNKFSLKYDGIYYTDDEFGSVRILAANRTKFPCGTIVQIEKQDGSKFMAVVMDQINTKLPDGRELMDLAYSSQTDKSVFGADGLTGNNITFNVQRWGW